jgi:hypothetical protein
MNREKKIDLVYTVIWAVVLCVYGAVVLYINFTHNPEFYCTDMYTDMNYAIAAWNQKSILPEGWIFGNQLYAVATPTLCALFYGMTGDACIAMGIASSLMTLGVMLSFFWMLMPVLPKLHHRLVAMVAFMTVPLLAGDGAFTDNGWQLLFTMCSYYACYAITLFLAFGCYLRKDRPWSVGRIVMLGLTCLMALGTGFQSLRQTLIMVCPLLAAMCVHAVVCLIEKKKPNPRLLIIGGSISLANLLGVAICKLVTVNQVTTIGKFQRDSLGAMPEKIVASISMALRLFGPLKLVAAGILCVLVVCLIIRVCHKKALEKDPVVLCALLLMVSVGGVLLVDTTTLMAVRSIYYFPLYALVAIAPVYAYVHFGKGVRIGVAALLLLCAISAFNGKLMYNLRIPRESPRVEQVSDYLLEQGITTVYSGWNLGEEVAIASDFAISAGFWNEEDHPFQQMKLLCDPAVFEAEPSQCAYLFRGKQAAVAAKEAAHELGTELVLLKYFPEANLYIYTAPVNLMHE